jgi:hypothetical protein
MTVPSTDIFKDQDDLKKFVSDIANQFIKTATPFDWSRIWDGLILQKTPFFISSLQGPGMSGWEQLFCKDADPSVQKVKVHRFSKSLYFPLNAQLPLERLYLGDLIWLYFHERMGIFQMLNRLVDDYARLGKLPIGVSDAECLEKMTRLIQSGQGSSAKERAATYQRSLGWTCENLPSPDGALANTAFENNWRNFLRAALAFYRGRNVNAILGATANQSAASVVGAQDAATSLWQTFSSFDTASNYAATFHGLMWVVGTLFLIEKLGNSLNLGMAATSTDKSALIAAAYETLVLGRPPSSTDASRYLVHHDCAKYGRRILLDLQGLKNLNDQGSLLKPWLEDAETEKNIEGYRSAWQRLTGEDLAPSTSVRMSST